MEAIKFLKYILSRIGIMIVLTLFSAFAGIVLIPALVTVFPSSTSAFKSFMTNSNVDSFIGFAVMLIFFLRLFYDDVNGVTLCSASSMSKDFEGNGGNKEGARKVGEMIAQAAKAKGIENVVFDRGGYLYHGRVQELADGAREGGLKF